MSRTIRIRAGTLRLQVERAEMPLDDLCGFASRRSRKRGFVFVSKVLGKHDPVRPSTMADTHALLAARLRDVPGPAVVIALAETATGLGQGVYEALGRDDALFIHTTRHRLRRPLALEFREPHSHAPDHLLYEPESPNFRSARSLILVDDEITTGRTLINLAAAYRRLNPALESVHFVCLTDWLGPTRRSILSRELEAPVAVHSLLAGSYEFEPDDTFDPGPAPDAVGRGEFLDDRLGANHGRLGIVGSRGYDFDAMIAAAGVRPGERVLVLGTGEFAHPPFRLARRVEERGHDVRFQSTTRSPLLVDGDLRSALEFPDNTGDGIANYVYNVANHEYDRILIGYETRPLPPEHDLPARLNAVPVYF